MKASSASHLRRVLTEVSRAVAAAGVGVAPVAEIELPFLKAKAVHLLDSSSAETARVAAKMSDWKR